MSDFFTFEQTPFELVCQSLRRGETINAIHLLTLLEGEDEEAVESAFETLEAMGVMPELSGLPVTEGSGQLQTRLALEEKLVRQGDLLQDLPEGDPLALYLQELAGIPVCGDVNVLAMELAQTGSENVRRRLADLSLSRVVQLAGEFTGHGVLLLDLLQEGSMGLWSGLLRLESGVDFETHRDWYIRFYLAKAVIVQARADGVGRMLQSKLEDYRRADRLLLTRLGRNPTVEEIAREMGVTPEQAYYYEEVLLSARAMEKTKAPEQKEEEPDAQQAVENTAYFQSRQRIAELMSALDEADATLLTLRFGLEGGLPQTPEQVGAKLGLTPQEVVAREAAALAKLRGSI